MRILPCWLALAVLGSPLHAQALEDRITDLFIFGEGEEVLFLGGSGGSDDPRSRSTAITSSPPP